MEVPSSSAKGDSLQEEGSVADISEADREAVDAKEDVWSMSGDFTYRHHVVPREKLYVPKESSFLTHMYVVFLSIGLETNG